MTARESRPDLGKVSRLRRLGGLGACVVVLTAYGSTAASTSSSLRSRATARAAGIAGAGTTLPGTTCPVFPADDIWNTKITGLPVDSHSVAWLKTMDASSTYLHPDYGPGGGKKTPYGIPYVVVSPTQPLVHVKFSDPGQSDRGPYPFSASTPIEGGQSASGDRHAIMVNPKTCTLYELYDAYYKPDGKSTAGSGAIWSLTSNKLRRASWTSADAAGLPILPGLVNYAEVMSGHIDHAIRFTAQTTDEAYLWPARHEAGAAKNASYPPMGARFRLNASFSLPKSECAAPCQTVITAMKQYGLILADNGSNWFFQGATNSKWTYTMVDQLKNIPASEFVAVNESSLECFPNSGQARQAGAPDHGCPPSG
ncbi:MAG: hypothetical protein ACLPQS_12125 [Acidimicrobiales bacterium]